MEYVYLIRKEFSNVYKIGVSKNVESRLKQLQTANDELLCITDTVKTDYAYLVETAAHRHFKRKRGEWFEMSIEDVINFRSICMLLDENFRVLHNSNSYFKKNYINGKKKFI